MDEQETLVLRAFAEEARRGLRGLDANLWRDRLERRYGELDIAFGWWLHHGQAGDALAMASTLAEFLRISGRVAIGRAWLDRGLRAHPVDDPLRAVALYEHGMLAFWQGADEEACSLHGRSLHLARRGAALRAQPGGRRRRARSPTTPAGVVGGSADVVGARGALRPGGGPRPGLAARAGGRLTPGGGPWPNPDHVAVRDVQRARV